MIRLILPFFFVLSIVLLSVSGEQLCGWQNPTGRCSSSAPCCSQWGYCGNGPYYCDPIYKCQSNCWSSSNTTSPQPGAPRPEPTKPANKPAPGIKPSKPRPRPVAVTPAPLESPTTNAAASKDYVEQGGANAPDNGGAENAELAALMKDDTFRENESPHYDPRGLYSGCFVKNVVAMTYDDGPSAPVTNKILDHLAAAGVKATFFVIGSNVNSEENRRTLKRAYNEGHIIASHTWSHPHLPKLSEAEIREEMRKTEDVIFKVIGVKPKYMRPPYGEVNEKVKRVLFDMGYKIFIWNLDTNDWQFYKDQPEKIYQEYEKQLSRFAPHKKLKSWVPLQHDLYDETANAQPEILSLIKNQGYEFINLTRCVRDSVGPYKTK